MFGGVIWQGMDGGFFIQGGSMYNNIALASLIGEFHDSTFSVYMYDLYIHHNV